MERKVIRSSFLVRTNEVLIVSPHGTMRVMIMMSAIIDVRTMVIEMVMSEAVYRRCVSGLI